MKTSLKVVESTGTSNWDNVEEIGTFKSQLQKGDKLFFSKKNLLSNKRVTVFIKENDEDKPKMLSCSEMLSNIVRRAIQASTAKKKIMRMLIDLKIIKNDQGYFLIPEGSQGEEFTFGDLVKEEPVSYEELAVV